MQSRVTMPEVVRTTCPYCGVGCGLRATRGAAGTPPEIRGDPEHPANFGRVCSKGAALADTLDLDGRLLTPRVRGRRATWADALDAVDNAVATVTSRLRLRLRRT